VKAPDSKSVTLSGPVLQALNSVNKPLPFQKDADGV
jgi:hypothetical protein